MISYKDNIQVTSTTTGTGTLTQAAAVTGFAAPASGDDGKTFTIMVKGVDASGIPTGEWELCESVYTHSGTTWSRGALLDSSTGSRVTFSAGTKHIAVVAPARVFGAAGGQLEISNQTVTTADITGAVGNFYVCTIAGLTANRNLTLPSAAVGERIGVHVLDGDDTYALILKGAASQTINGGSAATEWSRVFIKGETVIFRCIAANTWVVESDGRIPQKASMEDAAGTSIAINTTTKINPNSTLFDNANIADPTTSKSIKPRRSGRYSVYGFIRWDSMADQTTASCVVGIDQVTGAPRVTRNAYASGAAALLVGVSDVMSFDLATQTAFQLGSSQSGADPKTANTTAGSRATLTIVESL